MKYMKKILFVGVVFFNIILWSPAAFGQCVSLTTLSSAYTQNFDTLSNTAGSTTNNLTIPGWFMTETGGGARDNEQYAVDAGASTTGDTYSYGAAAATERSLAGLRSGTLIPLFGSCYTNNTGATISALAVAYNGEEWRLGTAARTDQLNFEYSTNATDLNTGTWTNVSALNFVTPDTATVGAKNGNAAADRTALSSTISSLSIPPGATFWIRWTDIDASGPDDGLGIDDFSLTPQGTTTNLSINDVSLNEGSSGTSVYNFTVSLSAPAPVGGVKFDIATADGTATTADGDYVSSSLTNQTIMQGNMSYTFSVTVNGDTTVEPNETFFVNVTNVTGANVTDGQGQGTIQNDDVATAVVALDSTNYFDDESQTLTVTVNRSVNTSVTTTVDYATGSTLNLGGIVPATGGASCTAGVDYITASGTLTFNPGDASLEVPIQLCSDPVIDEGESFQFTLSNPSNGVLGKTTSATAFINDTAGQFVDHSAITVGSGTEGNPYPATLTISNAPTNIGGIRLTLYDFTHINSEDLDLLLVGPQGQKYLFMADAGGASGLSEGATITFEDSAEAALPDSGQIFTGKYKPTTWEAGQTSFPSPAPEGPYVEAGNPQTALVTLASTFGGTNPNGTWSLYIRDDNNTFQRLGVDGEIAGGWGLQFIAPSAATVTVSGLVRVGKTPIANATVMISGGTLSQPLIARTNSFGNYAFDGLATGEIYVVTVVSNRYNFPQSSIILNLDDTITNADFEAEEN